MRKLLALLIILITIVLLPLAADSDLAVAGITGGYSSKDNTALLGFNGAYSYYASVNSVSAIGYGVHGDMLFGLNHPDDFLMSFGFISGLGLQFQLTSGLSMNFLIGPAVVSETGVVEPSVGIGVGADASISYFIGEKNAIGFTLGATAYPQFLIFDDARNSNFSILVNGYVGMALRFPASLVALSVLDYIIN